jgi:hypothetical protein
MSSLANQHLDQPFTESEIQAAVNELPTEKAPGPDRFIGVFFQILLGGDQARCHRRLSLHL